MYKYNIKKIGSKRRVRFFHVFSFLIFVYHSEAIFAQELNGRNWMRYMPDVSLSRLSIPGTHDSGAINFDDLITPNSAVITQTLSIREQLNSGVRFLDIRCRHQNGLCNIYHGNVYLLLQLTDVLNDVYGFLNENPSEAVIISIKQPEHSDPDKEAPDFESTIRRYIFGSGNSRYWYTKGSIPTLCYEDSGAPGKDNCARGKIVLLRRFSSKSSLGIDATSWPDNATGFSKTAPIYLQDNYNLGKYFIRPDDYPEKMKNVTDHWKSASKDNGQYLYLNYTSGVAFNGLGIPKINDVKDYINPRVNSFLSGKNGHFGVTIMDYITPGLARAIFMTNSRLTLNSDPDRDGVRTFAELSSGSDPFTKMQVIGSDPTINLALNVEISTLDHDVKFEADTKTIGYFSSTLPPGVIIDRNSGVLSGKPSKAGKYYATIKAADSKGKQTAKVWVFYVEDLPAFSYPENVDIKNGAQLSVKPTRAMNAMPIFQISEGALPPGLMLNTYSGEISGIPEVSTGQSYFVKILSSNVSGNYERYLRFSAR